MDLPLTRKWFPLQGELAPLTKKCCILINQYRFVPCWLTYFRTRLLEKLEKAKEEKRRRLEATSTATSTGTFTAQARKSSVS